MSYKIILACSLVLLAIGLSIAVVDAQRPPPGGRRSPAAALGTAFTYQGQLKQNGALVNGTCDSQFGLWDSSTLGTQVGTTQTVSSLPVTNGLFTTQLDFGANAFNGDARYLAIAPRCPAGSGIYTDLSPRQPLTAAPYALYASAAFSATNFSGTLAGDVTGPQNATTVAKINGSPLGNLSSASNGQVLQFNGSTWVPANAGAGTVTAVTASTPLSSSGGTTPNLSLTGIVPISNGGTGLSFSGSNGNFLRSNGAAWTSSAIQASDLPSGSGSYIQNTTSPQASANFNISGNGTLGGNLSVSGGTISLTNAFGTNILGTTTNQALDFQVNSQRALRLEPNGNSPNVIGGFSGNSVTPSAYGATIGGGGLSGSVNQVSANFGTIGGGLSNTASGAGTTIGGGQSNVITTTANYATIGGGLSNIAGGANATIGGGVSNNANGNSATIGGGAYNVASVIYATIGGGGSNTASGIYSTIGGGQLITASTPYATVGGGAANNVSGYASTIGGGEFNTASGGDATIGGGGSNTASNSYATVPGGLNNTAAGIYSFAAGRRAKANYQGDFVWGDSTNTDINSSDFDQFIARANGGFYFIQIGSAYTVPVASGFFLTTTTGAYLASGGSWTNASDRNAKENFATVNEREILKRLANLPVQTWNYKAEDRNIRHVGPVAQDFNAAFQVGKDDTSISTVDEGGVALAAIQGLHQLVQEREAEITKLKAESEKQQAKIDELQQQNASLDARLTALEQAQPSPRPSPVQREREIALALVIGAVGVMAYKRSRKGRGK